MQKYWTKNHVSPCTKVNIMLIFIVLFKIIFQCKNQFHKGTKVIIKMLDCKTKINVDHNLGVFLDIFWSLLF